MDKNALLMTAKERQRKTILENVKESYFTLTEAAQRMKITLRQARRLMRRYEEQGDNGLVHQNRGKPSNYAQEKHIKKAILELYKSKYEGFGPTFAAEKLEEDGYEINAETLRLWLKSLGLWHKKRKRSPYRKQRNRKEKFGELLQLDGSFHRWFGEDQPEYCLMNMVDDATGTTMALLDKEETTKAAMLLLKKWIERYGVPSFIYVDLKTVYISPKTLKLNENELKEITEAFTYFSRACYKLGIRIIKAYSPQAKGRVERKHAVFQDRFVKELRLRKIKSIDGGNNLLESYFLDHINKKFAKIAESPIDGHRDVKKYGDLEQIFCWEYIRQIHNDWTVRFFGKHFQIQKESPLIVRPKYKVIAREHLNEAVSIWYENKELTYKEIKPKNESAKETIERRPPKITRYSHSKEHPWKKGCEERNKKKTQSEPV